MLFELVYNSVASDANIQEAELSRILGTSRRNNQMLGITGALLYANGEFVQMLEGKRDVIQHLYYDVIAHDPRHRAPTVSWEKTVKQRSYGDYWMAFGGALPLSAEESARSREFLEMGLPRLDGLKLPSTGRRMLWACYQQIQGHTLPPKPNQ